MIQTKLILYAIALARHGNFAKAADSLGLSQPSLSRNIAMLEKQMGVPLFDRGPKGVIPTAFGRLLLERGASLIETEDSLLREIKLMGNLEHGTLVIGAGPYAAEISVGAAIAKLIASHPRLKVRVITDDPEEVRKGVMSAQIDVGIFEIGPPHRDDPLHSEPLPEHALNLYCRPGHPLTRMKELTAAKVLAFPLVTTLVRGDRAALVMASGPGSGKPVAAGTGRNTGDFEPAVHVNSLTMAAQIASQCDAIYPGPAILAAPAVRESALVKLDFSIPAMRTKYSLAYLKDRSRSPAAKAFIEVLHAVENGLKKEEDAQAARAARRK